MTSNLPPEILDKEQIVPGVLLWQTIRLNFQRQSFGNNGRWRREHKTHYYLDVAEELFDTPYKKQIFYSLLQARPGWKGIDRTTCYVTLYDGGKRTRRYDMSSPQDKAYLKSIKDQLMKLAKSPAALQTERQREISRKNRARLARNKRRQPPPSP